MCTNTNVNRLRHDLNALVRGVARTVAHDLATVRLAAVLSVLFAFGCQGSTPPAETSSLTHAPNQGAPITTDDGSAVRDQASVALPEILPEVSASPQTSAPCADEPPAPTTLPPIVGLRNAPDALVNHTPTEGDAVASTDERSPWATTTTLSGSETSQTTVRHTPFPGGGPAPNRQVLTIPCKPTTLPE